MTRRRGWLLTSAVWAVLVSAMALGLGACAPEVSSVEADLAEDFAGFTEGTVADVVTGTTREGVEVIVALDEDGVALFVGTSEWVATTRYVERQGGSCGFH